MLGQLLASAAIDQAPSPPAFTEVLRRLEPIEARLLEHVVRVESHRPPGASIQLDELAGFEELRWRHLDNLTRLGLIVRDDRAEQRRVAASAD